MLALHVVHLVVVGSSPLSIANSDPGLLYLSCVCRTVVGVVPAKLLSKLFLQNLLSELRLQNCCLSCAWLMLTCWLKVAVVIEVVIDQVVLLNGVVVILLRCWPKRWKSKLVFQMSRLSSLFWPCWRPSQAMALYPILLKKLAMLSSILSMSTSYSLLLSKWSLHAISFSMLLP